MQLEKAHTSGGTHVEFVEAGRKYRVDVKKMEQINTKSKVAREVQRICEGTQNLCMFFYFSSIYNIAALLRSFCYVLEVTQFEWQFYISQNGLALSVVFKHVSNNPSSTSYSANIACIPGLILAEYWA